VTSFGPDDYARHYLVTDDPRAQSGFTGDAARWEAARRAIVDGIERAGTLLDVGCANGLLMESIASWSPFSIEPYGVDFSPDLIELARTRLPHWSDRIWLGDVATWEPPRAFDFAHVRLDTGHLQRIAKWCRRLIVSSDGSFRRPDSQRAEPVARRMRELGLDVTGETYRRSDEHLVELHVAWSDQHGVLSSAS
jgi:trans-aconitate methyltransferase